MTSEVFIGIDVSKETLDIAIRPSGEPLTVSNDDEGVAALLKRIAPLKPVLIVLEATGGLQNLAAATLAEAGLAVAVANPTRTRNFAKTIGKLAKTDGIDAAVIAEYARIIKPPARPLPDKQQRELEMWLVHRRQLTHMLVQEKNRLSGAPKDMHQSIEGCIRFFEREIAEIDKKAASMIKANTKWRQKAELLKSAPGVGTVTAAALLAWLPELGTFDRKQIAALAGLAPYNRDSGKYRGRRSIWGGRAAVRTSLYMATITAMRTDERMKGFYARLRATGKKAKMAITAVMRKLLTALNAMLRDNQPWSDLATRSTS